MGADSPVTTNGTSAALPEDPGGGVFAGLAKELPANGFSEECDEAHEAEGHWDA